MTIENHAKVSKQIRAQGMVSTKLSRLQLKILPLLFVVLPFFQAFGIQGAVLMLCLRWCRLASYQKCTQ